MQLKSKVKIVVVCLVLMGGAYVTQRTILDSSPENSEMTQGQPIEELPAEPVGSDGTDESLAQAEAHSAIAIEPDELDGTEVNDCLYEDLSESCDFSVKADSSVSDEETLWMEENLYPQDEELKDMRYWQVADLEQAVSDGDASAAVKLSILTASQGNTAEAADWADKATKLAPDKSFPYRLKAIHLLAIAEGQFAQFRSEQQQGASGARPAEVASIFYALSISHFYAAYLTGDWSSRHAIDEILLARAAYPELKLAHAAVGGIDAGVMLVSQKFPECGLIACFRENVRPFQ